MGMGASAGWLHAQLGGEERVACAFRTVGPVSRLLTCAAAAGDAALAPSLHRTVSALGAGPAVAAFAKGGTGKSNCRSPADAGTWVRIKGGLYKGDLAKVVDVNPGEGKATIRLVRRCCCRPHLGHLIAATQRLGHCWGVGHPQLNGSAGAVHVCLVPAARRCLPSRAFGHVEHSIGAIPACCVPKQTSKPSTLLSNHATVAPSYPHLPLYSANPRCNRHMMISTHFSESQNLEPHVLRRQVPRLDLAAIANRKPEDARANFGKQPKIKPPARPFNVEEVRRAVLCHAALGFCWRCWPGWGGAGWGE